MGKFLPDSLSLMHVVLAGAAETERIPKRISSFSAWCLSAPWPLSTGHLTSEASKRLVILPSGIKAVSWSAGSLHEDGLPPEQALTQA